MKSIVFKLDQINCKEAFGIIPNTGDIISLNHSFMTADYMVTSITLNVNYDTGYHDYVIELNQVKNL